MATDRPGKLHLPSLSAADRQVLTVAAPSLLAAGKHGFASCPSGTHAGGEEGVISRSIGDEKSSRFLLSIEMTGMRSGPAVKGECLIGRCGKIPFPWLLVELDFVRERQGS